MTTTISRTALSAIALFALATTSPTAEAYELHYGHSGYIEWAKPSLTPDLVPNMMSADDIRAIEEAADRWGDSLGKVSINPVVGDSNYMVGNFDSEVAMVCDNFLTGGNDAGTWRIYDPVLDLMWEADTYINICATGPSVTPTTDPADRLAYGGSETDLTSLMVQHFGRQLGLDPEYGQYSTSGFPQTAFAHDGTDAHPYVSGDDGLGTVVLYGTGWTGEKVGLTHFKWVPESQVTRELAFTEVFDVEGRLRPSSWSDGMPRYLVFEGGDIQVEFTVEGLSTSPGPTQFDFYLSTNTTFTADDTHLGSTVMVPPMGTASAIKFDLSLPSGVTPGDYAIGVVATSPAWEYDLDNNTAFLLVEVSDPNTTCTPSSPCGHREGDCDSNADCDSGTTCKHNVGAKYGASSLLDVCELPTWDFCSADFPCASGEGDCDSNSDCLSGVCLHDVGTAYGYSSPYLDVCQ